MNIFSDSDIIIYHLLSSFYKHQNVMYTDIKLEFIIIFTLSAGNRSYCCFWRVNGLFGCLSC